MKACHIVNTRYTTGPNVSPQEIFEVFITHQAEEDPRGYTALMAHSLNNLLTSDWQPSIEFLDSLANEEKRRAGYLMEFSWRKMFERTERKMWLMEMTAYLKNKVEGSPKTRLFPTWKSSCLSRPNIHNDKLAEDWGLLD